MSTLPTTVFTLMLRVPEAAERLGIRNSTMRRWIMKRKIGYVRLAGRAIRIPAPEVEKLLEAGFVPARTCKRRPSVAGLS
jgi:excisionase family DNA binding protein